MKELTHEFFVCDPVEDAVRKAKVTLKNLGELSAVVPNQYVVGHVAFGVKNTTLRISWRPEGMDCKADEMVGRHHAHAPKGATEEAARTLAGRRMLGTVLTIEATSDEGGDAALRSALDRFEEAYLHFDRADFKPDRAGILPATIVGAIVVLALLLVLVAKKTDWMKPQPQSSPAAAASVSWARPAGWTPGG